MDIVEVRDVLPLKARERSMISEHIDLLEPEKIHTIVTDAPTDAESFELSWSIP